MKWTRKILPPIKKHGLQAFKSRGLSQVAGAIFLFITVMLITIICYWPAKTLVPLIENSVDVSTGKISEIHGTIWRGNLTWNAVPEKNAAFPVVRVEWRLQAYCLLTMKLCADVQVRDTNDQNVSKLQLQGSLALYYRPWLKPQPISWIDIKSLKGFAHPNALNSWSTTPWLKASPTTPTIEMHDLHITFDPNTLETKNAKGYIAWAGGEIETQLAVLGLPAPSGWYKQNYSDLQLLLSQDDQKTRVQATSTRVKPHLLNITLGENKIQVEVFGAAARWAHEPTTVANEELLIGFAQPLSSFVKEK